MSPAGTAQQGMSNPGVYLKVLMDSFLTQGIEDSSAIPREAGKGLLGWKYQGQSGFSAFRMVDFVILERTKQGRR